jgi:pre-rRNA-processing protein TSR3
MGEIRLFAVMEREDDPKKCTAKKLGRFGLLKEVSALSRVPRRAVILDPEADKALSREDLDAATRFGLGVLDCSWERLSSFPRLRGDLRHRALPFMLAANPTNFGKAQKLSSAEALAASLYILGQVEQAERLMAKFKWGPVFLDINRSRLDEYSACRNSAEVVSAQERMLLAADRH